MTTRQTAFVAGIAVVMLLIGGALYVAVAGSGPSATPSRSPSAGETTRPGPPTGTPGPSGIPGRPTGGVSHLWPVDEAQGRRAAREFAVVFSNYMPAGPGSAPKWVRSLAPYSTEKFLRIADKNYQKYWWYLTSGGLGAENAKVVSATTVWKRSELALYRVVVDRDARTFNGHPERNHKERVSWDVLVTGATEDKPKVAGCMKSDPRNDTELPEGEPADVP